VVRLFRVILPVPDLARAARVYAELLGLPGERVSDGRHYFDCGGTVLALYDSAADGDGPAGPTRYQPGQFFYFSVPDLAATHAAAGRLGFAVHAGGIRSMPWGETLFWATDPFGNPVSFVAAGSEFIGTS
jgi:catechol 2,3-dioxygenase-like lactoylglutathione lyase family enzyme